MDARNMKSLASGYTNDELQELGQEDQLALDAIGGDHEAGMSAAYTKLVHAQVTEKRYEEALQVCDEYLPLKSSLTDQVLHLYLNTAQDERDPTPFATHSELLDHECMYRVKQDSLAAQLTLERYKNWDVDTVVHTVQMCLQRVEAHPSTEDDDLHTLKQDL